MTLMAGDRLGPYVVVSLLGRGGMGEVYRAHDARLGRDVAIKLLSGDIADPARVRHRFEREARVAARLNHPNILTVFDVGEADGRFFIVTELLEGTTLRDRLDRGPIPYALALSWTTDVIDGLQAAHDQGVVHRDLKPDNLWITRDDRCKILDFGIAAVVGPAAAEQPTLSAPPTGAQILGTVGYMSPEQVRSLPVDGRSDLFSLGAVLYEMLSGRRPFARDTALQELQAIAQDDPSPLVPPPDCPPAVAGLVGRCLDKAPQRRFPSARDCGFALRALGQSQFQHVENRLASVVTSAGGLAQNISYCTTRDGVRIAYASTGRGPLLVRVLGWFTHLEREWAWPELRAIWEQLSLTHTVIRYDGRGIGLSDRWAGDFTEDTRQLDLEAVLEAIGGAPMALLGISEGGWTAAAFAIDHPERVSHLVVYGGYARGAASRRGYDAEEDRALLTLMRKGWGRETPAFRQLFTSQFYREDCEPALLAHFNEMQSASADPDTAARYLASCHARLDGTAMFANVRVPTLVAHRRDDRSVSFEEGRHLASVVPGARFLPLPGSAHYFPTGRSTAHEPGGVDLAEAITAFIGRDRA